MEDARNDEQIKMLQDLQRKLSAALDDLKKIKAKLGIDLPGGGGTGGGGTGGGTGGGGFDPKNPPK